jgi:hypothetical protein
VAPIAYAVAFGSFNRACVWVISQMSQQNAVPYDRGVSWVRLSVSIHALAMPCRLLQHAGSMYILFQTLSNLSVYVQHVCIAQHSWGSAMQNVVFGHRFLVVCIYQIKPDQPALLRTPRVMPGTSEPSSPNHVHLGCNVRPNRTAQ